MYLKSCLGKYLIILRILFQKGCIIILMHFLMHLDFLKFINKNNFFGFTSVTFWSQSSFIIYQGSECLKHQAFHSLKIFSGINLPYYLCLAAFVFREVSLKHYFNDDKAIVNIWNLKLQQCTFSFSIQVLFFLCKGLY